MLIYSDYTIIQGYSVLKNDTKQQQQPTRTQALKFSELSVDNEIQIKKSRE